MAKKEAKAKKENSKNKKSFFKDFKAELKKVSWPTPKQLLNNTIAVITIVFITAIIVFVLDIGFETLNKHGVEKVKEIIRTDDTTNTTEENEQTDETTQDIEEGNTTQESSENETATQEENNTQNNVE